VSQARRRRRPWTGRIGLFGLFGIGNFGNEASLASALEALRREVPDARPSTISTDPERTLALHGVPGIAIGASGPFDFLNGGGRARRLARPLIEVGRWVTAIRHARNLDLILVPGTGILDDFGQRPTQLPLDVLRWAVAARLAGCPLAYLAIGAGPISHPLSRRLMRAALAQADICSYRDDDSRDFMSKLGRDTDHDEVWPDLVFAVDRQPAEISCERPVRSVALGVMDYRGWRGTGEDAERFQRAYVERMIELARRVHERGDELCLIIGDEADLEPATTIAETVGDGVSVVPSADLGDVLDALSQVDVVVASRYHNLVAAMIVGVPAISISYAPKHDQLMQRFGLGELCEPIDSFDPAAVIAHLDAVERDRVALGAAIRATTAELQATLSDAMARCLRSLRSRSRQPCEPRTSRVDPA
jgi:polysaccharide pyruvyl transferase WcaK-like protein